MASNKNEKKAIHQPGKFVWFEVRTPTPEKTAKFFTDVVGWNISSMQSNYKAL